MAIDDLLTPPGWSDWFNEIYKKYEEQKEQEAFDKAKEDKLIEEAVLIMNPKHKNIIVGSELSKATILWSNAVEEGKAYMVIDEELKEDIRRSVSIAKGEI